MYKKYVITAFGILKVFSGNTTIDPFKRRVYFLKIILFPVIEKRSLN